MSPSAPFCCPCTSLTVVFTDDTEGQSFRELGAGGALRRLVFCVVEGVSWCPEEHTAHGVSPWLWVLPDHVNCATVGVSAQTTSSRQPRARSAPGPDTQGQWERAVRSLQCHHQLCGIHKATSPKVLSQMGSSQLTSIPPEFAPLYLAGAFHPVGLK